MLSVHRGQVLKREVSPRVKVWPLEVNSALRGVHTLTLKVNVPPFVHPRVNTLHCLEEWRVDQTVFTPRGQIRP
jgi:hypothetical protein